LKWTGKQVPSGFPEPRERWGWKGTTGIRGEPAARNAAQRNEGSWAEDLFGEEKGRSPSAPIKSLLFYNSTNKRKEMRVALPTY